MSARPGIAPARPELATEGFPQRRPRWIELATSADHKDIGRAFIVAALGFLFLAALELCLMRLQLAVPENTFLSPVTFNRLLSVYGATSIFLFGIPLAIGLFYYVVPLQIGARTTALPRIGQLGFWLYVLGASVLYVSFVFTPPEAGVNPLPPLSELAYLPNNGVDVWLTAVGMIALGYVLWAINMIATLRVMRAPGLAWRRMPPFAWAGALSSWLLMVIGPIMLAAITMLMIDRNFNGVFFSGDAGGAPLLWQHLSWIFYNGAYMLLLIFAFGAIAEIASTFSGKPLFNRGALMIGFAAIAVFGTLAWMQNMYSTPIGSGWDDFGMLMSMFTAVAIGVVIFNLIATLVGGAIRSSAALLFALGAISTLSIGLAGELVQSMIAVAWQLHNTTDATAATHYALTGAAVFGGFAALHYWYPKLTGRVMGETLGAMSFWTMLIGANVAFLPLFLAGLKAQPVDVYKFFDGTGVNTYNLIASIGTLVLAIGILLTLINAIVSLRNGSRARPDHWRGTSLEWFTLSPPPIHNFDVVPDVRGPEPLRDIRNAIEHRDSGAPAPAESGQPVA